MATITIQGEHVETTIIEKSADLSDETLYSFTCSKGIWCEKADELTRGHYDGYSMADVIEWACNHADQPHD